MAKTTNLNTDDRNMITDIAQRHNGTESATGKAPAWWDGPATFFTFTDDASAEAASAEMLDLASCIATNGEDTFEIDVTGQSIIVFLPRIEEIN